MKNMGQHGFTINSIVMGSDLQYFQYEQVGYEGSTDGEG